MDQKSNLKIDQLSHHIFWDIDSSKLNPDKNKKVIIQRVLDYGLLDDWNKISAYYSMDVILSTVKQLRNIERKSVAFIAAITKTSLTEFKCFTTKQSKDQLWTY